MLHWVMYDATKALSWRDKVRAGSLQCTVGEHNSAMAMLASALDVLSDPAAIAPPGSSRMQYPELTYPGPVEQFAGKACPVVGTYRTAPLDPDRAALFNACVEALRVNAWTHPAPGAVGGTAPSGALLSTQYPAGVLGVDGYAAPCVYPADDPAAPLTEDASAVPVAQFLGVAMAVADQLTADSANGRPHRRRRRRARADRRCRPHPACRDRRRLGAWPLAALTPSRPSRPSAGRSPTSKRRPRGARRR